MQKRTKQDSTGEHRYFKGLNALRALAIFGVTFFHFNPQIFKGGYLGVILFFVLTGFLLAYTSLEQDEAGEFSPGRFYKKRVKRLYPELLFVLFFSVAAVRFFVPWAVKGLRPEILSILFGYNNWWQIVQNADYFTRIANASPFTHLWFLSIEVQYILIWPLLFLGLKALQKHGSLKKAMRLLLGLAAISAVMMAVIYDASHQVTRVYYGTDTRLFSLLFGAALGVYQRQADQNAIKRHRTRSHGAGDWKKHVLYGIMAAAVIFSYFTAAGSLPFIYNGGMAAYTALFGMLLMWQISDRRPYGKALDRVKLLNWIGEHSYGLFLWQYPVIFVFQNKGWFDSWAGKAAALLLVVILSALSKFLTDACFSKNHGRIFAGMGPKRRIMAIAAAGFSVILIGLGVFFVVTDHSSKAAAQGRLKNRLVHNQEALSHQKGQKTAYRALDPPAPKWHYAKSGNTAKVSTKGVTIIGDSVTLDASPELKKKFPDAVINAEQSRHIGDELDWVKAQRKKHRLGQTVVISLGTNGELYSQKVEALLKVLGKNRSVFWVNVYGPSLDWTDANNQYLIQLSQKHRNVTVIDWNSQLSAHPEWLWEDGIHPNPEGSKAYAALIYKKVQDVQKKQEKIENNYTKMK
ncbi:acyltransferase family protein [Pseudoramibacter sp.]|jgi:peptidoglycan/LPS O-acetylase OafA/YrhL/lysophospholipase L1-like esterase|uniref:acyltransferase family protein n=1 Tax=Pseudoramibacter sp. TaxID=2034862 RepID=UPI0025FD4853|nr:acyltransferase family protein [Pseudoramibacter sp.]MCH4072527.1 acetyltransferase [Pseudoramibacter sp.]MCH4106298.1 acetyltransferase [Pseudoramibacter sp.]